MKCLTFPTLLLISLVVSVCARAEEKYDSAARAKTIAPFIDERTLAVACVDVTRVKSEHLAALYVRKLPWPAWEVGVAALALLAASVAAIRLARAQPYLTVGWCWYVGTLVPVIGLVQVGMQTTHFSGHYCLLIMELDQRVGC